MRYLAQKVILTTIYTRLSELELFKNGALTMESTVLRCQVTQSHKLSSNSPSIINHFVQPDNNWTGLLDSPRITGLRSPNWGLLRNTRGKSLSSVVEQLQRHEKKRWRAGKLTLIHNRPSQKLNELEAFIEHLPRAPS